MDTHTGDRSLPPDQAFVIRFRAGSDPELERVDGRIEHVVSGRSVRFGSYDEILGFIRRILAEHHTRAA